MYYFLNCFFFYCTRAKQIPFNLSTWTTFYNNKKHTKWFLFLKQMPFGKVFCDWRKQFATVWFFCDYPKMISNVTNKRSACCVSFGTVTGKHELNQTTDNKQPRDW